MIPKLNDLQSYLVNEFVDDYHEGRMSRRDMIRRGLGITGGVAATATLLLGLGCAPAPAPSPTAESKPATSPPTPVPASATSTPMQASSTPAAKPTTAAATAPASTAGPTSAAAASPTAGASSAASQPTPGGPRGKYSVKADDPDVSPSDVTFPGEGATLMGYYVTPKTGGPFPAVMVCHENRGLVEHVRDVTRRLAKAGYAALAVDLLSRDGGTTKVDPGAVPGKLTANPDQNVRDFQSAFSYLQSQESVQKDKIGMIGFCFGGGITWRVATAIPDLKAAVPYYGPAPALEDVPKIQAAVLGIYAEQDQRITGGAPPLEDALKNANKTFEFVIYPGANHAFNNDTGANWNESASDMAWERTLAWFKKYLI